jgi:hypothetical protein
MILEQKAGTSIFIRGASQKRKNCISSHDDGRDTLTRGAVMAVTVS